MESFSGIGIIKSDLEISKKNLDMFKDSVSEISKSRNYSKASILQIFQKMLPSFEHNEKGIYLDSKM